MAEFTLDVRKYSPGFTIEMENGYIVSVRFGTGNYCSNRDLDFDPGNFKIGEQITCKNAEVAIITPEGKVLEPQGYVLPDAASKAMYFVALGNIDAALETLEMVW